MICPKCGKVTGDVKTCPFCGEDLTAATPLAPPDAANGKKMTTCKACGAQMAKSAKTCPNCGAKNKKPIYKRWWLWVLVVLVLLFVIAVSGSDDDQPTSAGTTTVSDNKGASNAEKATAAPITYAKYDVTDLFKALDDNAIKAKNEFKNQYVELTGYISNMDASGDYIDIGANPNSYDYMFESVQCYIKSDEQLQIITELSKGDRVTIRGQITDVGEIMGYSLNIDSIN